MATDTTNMSYTDIKNLMILDVDFKLAITGQMEKYGGSFVKALATTIIFADPINLAKIADTFMNCIKEYIPDEYKRTDNA